MVEGAGWMVRNGYGEPGDLEHCEESGAIEGADPSAVGDKPRKRGLRAGGHARFRQSLSGSAIR